MTQHVPPASPTNGADVRTLALGAAAGAVLATVAAGALALFVGAVVVVALALDPRDSRAARDNAPAYAPLAQAELAPVAARPGDSASATEQQLERRVRDLLAPLVGADAFVARVSADFDSTEEEQTDTATTAGGSAVTRRLAKAPRLARLSVAVVIDERAAVDASTLAPLVKRAVGFDEDRGDELAVTRGAFVRSAPTPQDAADARAPYAMLALAGLALLALAVGAVGTVVALRVRRARTAAPVAAEPVAPARQLTPEPAPPDAARASAPTGPAAVILDADPADVALLLEREPPGAAAVILALLPAPAATRVLERMPAAAHPALLRAAVHAPAVAPAMVDELLAGVADELRLLGRPRAQHASGARGQDGAAAAVTMLRRIPARGRRSALDDLSREDPGLAEELGGKLLAFEDIALLGRRELQTFLQHCDSKTLAVALKGAPADAAEHILTHLSLRTAAALREEVELLGAVRASHVDEAQAEIVRLVLKLADDGKLALPGTETLV
jgi:flagellar motor switch protein FliG